MIICFWGKYRLLLHSLKIKRSVSTFTFKNKMKKFIQIMYPKKITLFKSCRQEYGRFFLFLVFREIKQKREWHCMNNFAFVLIPFVFFVRILIGFSSFSLYNNSWIFFMVGKNLGAIYTVKPHLPHTLLFFFPYFIFQKFPDAKI